MFSERTSVGLDVHARSIVGCGLDTVSGAVARRRLSPTLEGVSAWLSELPAPVAVAYEAGPTGFGLARQLTAAGTGVWSRRRRNYNGRLVIGSRPTC